MPSILVRDVPDPLHRVISQMAAEHRRSLRQEVITILEAAAKAWLESGE